MPLDAHSHDILHPRLSLRLTSGTWTGETTNCIGTEIQSQLPWASMTVESWEVNRRSPVFREGIQRPHRPSAAFTPALACRSFYLAGVCPFAAGKTMGWDW